MKVPIHSIETLGTVDGPGLRTIFFLQGCPLRCAYCHNPDSIRFVKDDEDIRRLDVEDILKILKRYSVYYRRGGGVTFSGGEPLMHGAFLAEALPRIKEAGYNICLDTSGYGPEKYFPDILPYVDTILLDIKQMNESSYQKVSKISMTGWLRFCNIIMTDIFKGKIWLRHVMVPGWTDNEASMDELWELAQPILPKLERIEILPYHRMGLAKYEQIGMEYRLKDVPAMDKQKALAFQMGLLERLRQSRL